MLDGAVAEDGHVTTDLLCFSHLRWDFVYQRPQHLLSRAAKTMRVLFWEEPLYTETSSPLLSMRLTEEGVRIARPTLPWGVDPATATRMQRRLLDGMLREQRVIDPILWYYTPLALDFSGHLRGRPTVYDCMDELAAFAGADSALPARELELLTRASLVFAGGASLFEAKRAQHDAVHCFPSGVDLDHFLPARGHLPEPADQAPIPHPRIGFFGVIDERLDGALLARVAEQRPDLQFVLIGPTAKVEPAALPHGPNLHYLGPKSYAELPAYIAHWNAAMMPFALNEATRFISPTKTPEYLAAGRPVVSTAITDVVRSWGSTRYVGIAADAATFAAEADRLQQLPSEWRDAADVRLREISWDRIWAGMLALIEPARRAPVRARRVVATRQRYDALVVGAGFAGAVLAERLAAGSGQRVLVVDRRSHIGGNAHDRLDAAGVLIHPYGPHVFHTNSPVVFDYLSRFTAWRPYEHRVLAQLDGRLFPIPINRTTVNRFFGVDLAEAEVGPFLCRKAEPIGQVCSSADVVLGTVGRELYEAFFQNYTRKQWGLDPSQLDKSVTSRVPVRTDDDDRYFDDRFQMMPLHGFTRMFEAMLAHPNITVATSTAYTDVESDRYDELIFTGPIDEFFDYRFGKLPYRSLEFRHETQACALVQPVAVINHPSADVPFTRVTEFKHITGQSHHQTSLCYEYPATSGEPYYPIPREENAALFRRYRELGDATAGVTFVGRLATYRYYNMDQVVGQALAAYDRLARKRRGADAGIAAAAD